MHTRARQLAQEYLSRSLHALRAIDLDAAAGVAELLIRARAHGQRVFIVGNGGSASTASHMAVDFSKTSAAEHGLSVDAMALVDNAAVVTAIANDFEFDRVFSDQVSRSISPGDVLVAISASGNSPNVIRAAEAARAAGASVVALTGFGGGELARRADRSVVIDSSEYGPVEDGHLVLNHLLTYVLRALDNQSAGA